MSHRFGTPKRPLVLLDMSLHPEALAALTGFARVRRVDRRELMDRDGVGLLCYSPTLDDLEALPNLRAIACHVCLSEVAEAASSRGISVSEAQGLWDDVADHALGILLATMRRIPQADSAIRAGRWTGGEDLKATFSGRSLRGATIGIIGLGRIGRRVATRLAAFQCSLLYCDVRPDSQAEQMLGLQRRALHDLLAEADVVLIALPLDTSTSRLVGRRELSLMRAGTFLVNISRGQILDQHALVDALASGHLAGAALDVFTEEPMRLDDPLSALQNVVLTPHLAGSTYESDRRLVEALEGELAPPTTRTEQNRT